MKYIFLVVLLTSVLHISCGQRQRPISINENIITEQITPVQIPQNPYGLLDEELSSFQDDISLRPRLEIDQNGYLTFSAGRRANVWHVSGWVRIDFIRVYDSKNKDSEYDEIHNELVALLRLDDTDDWLYLIASRGGFIEEGAIDIHGYINIFDMPRCSFAHTENRILSEHEKFQRFGPLLLINHNGNFIRVWDRFGGRNGISWLRLEEYWPEYNEILLSTGGGRLGGHGYQIENLDTGDWFWIVGRPHFNSSRTFAAVVAFRNEFGHSPFATL